MALVQRATLAESVIPPCRDLAWLPEASSVTELGNDDNTTAVRCECCALGLAEPVRPACVCGEMMEAKSAFRGLQVLPGTAPRGPAGSGQPGAFLARPRTWL